MDEHKAFHSDATKIMENSTYWNKQNDPPMQYEIRWGRKHWGEQRRKKRPELTELSFVSQFNVYVGWGSGQLISEPKKAQTD